MCQIDKYRAIHNGGLGINYKNAVTNFTLVSGYDTEINE